MDSLSEGAQAPNEGGEIDPEILARANVLDRASRFSGRGRGPSMVEISEARTVSEAEAMRLQFMGAPVIQKLKSSHHSAAKAIARGCSLQETSAITGYSIARINQLLQDPTFSELVTFYQGVVEQEFTDVLGRMKALSLDAMEEIQDRLDTNPSEIKTEELLKISTSFLDRTGHAPQQKVSITTTTLSKDDLLSLRAAAQESVVSTTTLPALKGDSNG